MFPIQCLGLMSPNVPWAPCGDTEYLYEPTTRGEDEASDIPKETSKNGQ
jgi:hypothetical protein